MESSKDVKLTDSGPLTVLEYWDCDCEHHYIHPKSCKRCTVCGTLQADSPDSRKMEVRQMLAELEIEAKSDMFHVCDQPLTGGCDHVFSAFATGKCQCEYFAHHDMEGPCNREAEVVVWTIHGPYRMCRECFMELPTEYFAKEGASIPW